METLSALLAICAGSSPVPVNSPHKGQWRGTFMFSLICARKPWGWWFETPSWSLWRQCNAIATKSNWLHWSKISLLNDTNYLILSTDGSVWTAGSNEQGQLSGDTTSRPAFTKVQGLPAVKEIAAGFSHCIVLTHDNEVTVMIFSYAWAEVNKPPPVDFFVGDISDFVKITCLMPCVAFIFWCQRCRGTTSRIWMWYSIGNQIILN